MKKLWQTDGKWFKGNLHMHTTRSDGGIGPEEAARIYREAGYDFIALTDHWKQSGQIEEPGFLQLSGCEFDTGSQKDLLAHPVFHLVGAGMERPVDLTAAHDYPPQKIIDAIREAGGAVILAHPAWSLTQPENVLPLRDLAAAEIYNTVSGIPGHNARPESSLYFDLWAARGLLLPVTAADDCHAYAGEKTTSYMMVNAPALTREALMEAIGNGNFYASQGPRFENVTYDGGTVEVSCSPVKHILFYSDSLYAADRAASAEEGKTLISAGYALKPSDHYVRVELIDEKGRHAWCRPFAVERT